MKLNETKGKMYNFITHTCNFIKGVCPHNCQYCFMRKWWPQMSAPRLDEKEFKGEIPHDKYIFVGSSIDMFAEMIPLNWIRLVLEHCRKGDNTYLFQSKNPARFGGWEFPKKTILCTTVETNRTPCKLILGSCPSPEKRILDFAEFEGLFKRMITIEPIMDFDIDIFISWMAKINPMQINIGADSGRNNLPEPSRRKLELFIASLKAQGFNLHLKDTLNRLLGGKA